MDRNGGFISIIALIVLSVCISMAMYILYIVGLENFILISSKKDIQSFYNSESKIFTCIYDEKYFKNQLMPNLVEEFRAREFTNKKKIKIDKSDLEDGDKEANVTMEFKDIDGRRYMTLQASSLVNGLMTKLSSRATVVNYLFELKRPILHRNSMEDKYIEQFQSLEDKIREDISTENIIKHNGLYDFESKDYTSISLSAEKISCKRDSMTGSYIEPINREEIVIIGRKCHGENIQLNIVEAENSKKKNLSGLIYIDGNINICTDLDFSGIIVVNEGEVVIESGSSLNVSGMIIYLNNDREIEEQDNLYVIYNGPVVYKYGPYLPGFLDIKIDLIKSN